MSYEDLFPSLPPDLAQQLAVLLTRLTNPELIALITIARRLNTDSQKTHYELTPRQQRDRADLASSIQRIANEKYFGNFKKT